jgi:hypothetical protein
MQELHRRDGTMARFGLRELVAYATLLVLLECGLAFSAASFELYSVGWGPVVVVIAAGSSVVAICQLVAVLRQSRVLSRLVGSVFMSIGRVGALLAGLPILFYVIGFLRHDDGDDDRTTLYLVIVHLIVYSLIASWFFIGIVMLKHGYRCARRIDLKDSHR